MDGLWDGCVTVTCIIEMEGMPVSSMAETCTGIGGNNLGFLSEAFFETIAEGRWPSSMALGVAPFFHCGQFLLFRRFPLFPQFERSLPFRGYLRCRCSLGAVNGMTSSRHDLRKTDGRLSLVRLGRQCEPSRLKATRAPLTT